MRQNLGGWKETNLFYDTWYALQILSRASYTSNWVLRWIVENGGLRSKVLQLLQVSHILSLFQPGLFSHLHFHQEAIDAVVGTEHSTFLQYALWIFFDSYNVGGLDKARQAARGPPASKVSFQEPFLMMFSIEGHSQFCISKRPQPLPWEAGSRPWVPTCLPFQLGAGLDSCNVVVIWKDTCPSKLKIDMS